MINIFIDIVCDAIGQWIVVRGLRAVHRILFTKRVNTCMYKTKTKCTWTNGCHKNSADSISDFILKYHHLLFNYVSELKNVWYVLWTPNLYHSQALKSLSEWNLNWMWVD